MAAAPRRRLAIILSGGGARGAYEAGVLSFIFDELTRLRGTPPRVDILCGTSVGAINSAYLAAHLADPTVGVRRLVDLYAGLKLDDVLGFGMKQMTSLPRVLLGGGSARGVFDVRPMLNLVEREIPWRAVTRNMRKGLLQALSVSATEVSTGRTVIFMQTSPTTTLPSSAPPRTLIRSERVGPQHALASAAIPLLFPPVQIGSQLYVDGGVRQNTPIAPAIRLGATHVLVIGTSRLVRGVEHPRASQTRAPGATFLLGKILNALLLDHLDHDLAIVDLLNDVLESGIGAFGPEFVSKLNDAASLRGGHPLDFVRTLVVRPTERVGKLAADHMRSSDIRGSAKATRLMLRALDSGAGDDADLASYLLFDGGFARRLIDLGRADARARRTELLEFFAEVDESPPSAIPEGGGGDWSMPPPAVG